MERSSGRAINKAKELCWDLFSRTGKIAYYGGYCGCQELLSEYERGGAREFTQSERERSR